jgi:thiol-disulfide isomerase/thioredoxin
MTTATPITPKQVMSAERFAKGQTWQQYSSSIKANVERFKEFYDTFKPDPQEVEFYKKFNEKKGGVKIVAIGADWCPDVVRGIPVIARVAEAAGMDLRIFPKEENMDLMGEYLWRHTYESIPVFVFFDKDWKELGHFTEGPVTRYKFMADLNEELSKQGLSDEERTKIVRERRAGVQMDWARDTVKEIREQILYRVM